MLAVVDIKIIPEPVPALLLGPHGRDPWGSGAEGAVPPTGSHPWGDEGRLSGDLLDYLILSEEDDIGQIWCLRYDLVRRGCLDLGICLCWDLEFCNTCVYFDTRELDRR